MMDYYSSVQYHPICDIFESEIQGYHNVISLQLPLRFFYSNNNNEYHAIYPYATNQSFILQGMHI